MSSWGGNAENLTCKINAPRVAYIAIAVFKNEKAAVERQLFESFG
jgi:hypothetical protein